MGDDVVDLECEEFLELVWGDSKGWVDLPAKIGPYWAPWHHQYEGEVDDTISQRIDYCLRGRESLYFSVSMFSKRGRRIEDALPTHWLWADLDEVDPASVGAELMPTIAWLSSPGRYQALWRLTRTLKATTQARLNQALSYYLGADHGGWDTTQVLRLPGTRNFKYEGAPMVELLWVDDEEDEKYDPRQVWDIVKGSLPIADSKLARGASDSGTIPHLSMPPRAAALLRARPEDIVEGERSQKLWAIECLLAEAGWSEQEIFTVTARSAWNKWAGVGTGESRLRAEIRKAIHHVSRKQALGQSTVATTSPPREDPVTAAASTTIEPETEEVQPDPRISYASFMQLTMKQPKWLIEDIWTAGSHGILGGEPKTSKTTLALAAALSVATGNPFLGKYPVRTQGPVLFIQEENAEWMIQDRLRKLSHFYGMIPNHSAVVRAAEPGGLGSTVVELQFPSDAPIQLVNSFGLNLTQDDHRDLLWSWCDDLRPTLVVIDPMYLVLTGLDYDKARDLSPYLRWFLSLRKTFGCAIMLVHHFRKATFTGGADIRHGQRLLGSTTFHGFVDTALYAEQLSVPDPGWVGCKVEREFRSMAPQGPLNISMSLGDVGALDMQCRIGSWDVQTAIEDLVRETPGITAIQVSRLLGIDKRTVIGRCRDSEVVEVVLSQGGRGKSHQLNPVLNGHKK